jgi:hypothetical protein
MALQNERGALHRGRVRALSAFGQALLDQSLGICQLGNLATGITLPAEIIRQTLAIRGLSKHARECVLADAARAGEEKRVRDT